jgi:epoxyqueuosine reductase QueG
VQELIQITIDSGEDSPPNFHWDEWYESVGGRSINIPEVTALRVRIEKEQYPRFDGPVASSQHKFSSPGEAATHIKEKAIEFGADIVGVCEIEPNDIYRGKSVTEKFAIAVGQRMRWKEFQVVPSKESAIECMRIYHSLGESVVLLAEYIRSLGYPCRVEHPIGDSNILHLPIGLKAGFGELGRHGSIIHPKLGPLFRMGSVITNLEMAIDHPIDAGIAKFCDNCRACRIYCPADAVPDERDPNGGKDHLGNDRYVVDTGRCFPYFAKYNYCSICLPVCVYNHKEWAKDFDGFETNLFPDVQMLPPPHPVELPEGKKHYYQKLKDTSSFVNNARMVLDRRSK